MPSPRPAPPASSRRGLLVAVVVIVGVLGAVALVLDWLADAGPSIPEPTPPPPRVEPPVAAALPSPTESPASTAPPVLALSGEFPTEGTGRFRFAGGDGEVLGESGPLYSFRVAVESGIDEAPAEFAEFVEVTLAHRLSWTAEGQVRFQRVPKDGGRDFTVYLATSATTARMCATAGLDVVGAGLPEGGVSCRIEGGVVLNLSRWRLSVPQYVAAGAPLEVYRQMLVNHEVGHQLGYGHEACPGDGEPAPVMQQQTIDLGGCVPNPWPYRDGERYTGPPVA